MLQIAIVNGPNLNLLGTREKDIYGSKSFETYFSELEYLHKDVKLSYYQSNIEGELINFLHDCQRNSINGIVLNAGAYTHTSIALADAIAAIRIPVIEVHISNILAREEFRRTSYISGKCIGSISGLGLNGYHLSIEHLKSLF